MTIQQFHQALGDRHQNRELEAFQRIRDTFQVPHEDDPPTNAWDIWQDG